MILAKVTAARGGYSKASSRDIIWRDGFDGVSPAADDRALDSFADLPQDVTQPRVFSALIESFVEGGQASKEADVAKTGYSCCRESST